MSSFLSLSAASSRPSRQVSWMMSMSCVAGALQRWRLQPRGSALLQQPLCNKAARVSVDTDEVVSNYSPFVQWSAGTLAH